MTSRRLMNLPNWWEDSNDNLKEACDDFYRCYWYYLCVIYGILCIIALTQLIRIKVRVPGIGWTTQKVFQLLNVVVCFLRALTFGLYEFMDDLEDSISSYVLHFVIFDLPSLLFLTTYTLWVLFWAEIYHQSESNEIRKFRPYFIIANLAIYQFQGFLWLLTIPDSSRDIVRYISAIWLAILFTLASIGFIIYGRCLFLILKQLPESSHGRNRKLNDIASIASICAFAFALRSVFLFLYVINKHDFDVDLMHNGILNIVFYLLCEVLPTISVLIILHRLPPRKPSRKTPPSTPLPLPSDDPSTPLTDEE